MTYVLDFRGANVGGPVLPGQLVEGRLSALQMAGDVTFLLHGFNVDRAEGKATLKRFAEHLTMVPHHALVATLWPGDHWAGAFSYSAEGRDADDTALELAKFIYTYLRKSTRVSFATHSLGARVALQVIKLLKPYGYTFAQACLMAAAVDDFSLGDPSQFRDAARGAQRVAVLASRQDLVLRYAYPAGDLFQSWRFMGQENSGQALGYHGPRTRGSHAPPGQVLHTQIADPRNASHSDYLPGPRATPNQRAAMQFVNDALSGRSSPRYP
ncbi:MAG: alpha/beta hydrolase [Rhodothermales bacterium]|nr:alpha/beta hydrolase [Rhodothermales bacterium]